MSAEAVLEAARAWLAADPDPETRAELRDLLAAAAGEGSIAGAALADLHDRFDVRLVFGTAGLRGRLGAGPGRMNRVVVLQTTAGLARYLAENNELPSVVIGYDGRKNSSVFAADAAAVLARLGIPVTLMPRRLPTPVLAFAVRELDASAGIMITASHNPAEDNGYKLYLGGDSQGSQLVSPADARVLRHIEDVVRDTDVAELTAALGPATSAADITLAAESILEHYVQRTVGWLTDSSLPIGARSLNWVYTPMHGVGWETASRVFAAAGISEPRVVAEQLTPDPDFPTVAFPNPEEPGALDLAFSTATAASSELVIANDPDADRLAVAVPADGGGWQRLSGNDVGLLLGWLIAERHSRAGRTGNFASSLVSTPGIAAVAAKYGFGFVETLTGFKWISRVPKLLFGFEEALGYLIDPDKVRDKDGISAALAALELMLTLKGDGRTLADTEEEFDATFGHFASEQISIRVAQLSEIGATMTGLRERPPSAVGGLTVLSADDLSAGSAALPASDVLRYRLDGGARLIVRPSGTEPKLKLYLDVESTDGSVQNRRAAARGVLSQLREAVPQLLER